MEAFVGDNKFPLSLPCLSQVQFSISYIPHWQKFLEDFLLPHCDPDHHQNQIRCCKSGICSIPPPTPLKAAAYFTRHASAEAKPLLLAQCITFRGFEGSVSSI